MIGVSFRLASKVLSTEVCWSDLFMLLHKVLLFLVLPSAKVLGLYSQCCIRQNPRPNSKYKKYIYIHGHVERDFKPKPSTFYTRCLNYKTMELACQSAGQFECGNLRGGKLEEAPKNLAPY